MFNANHRYKIHWEITDLCNLKCPMCPRTNISDHCRPVKEVQNNQFFLNDVKKYFPDSFLEKVKRIDFCGNFGDPCNARDFYEICELLIKSYNINIVGSTNGSMRSPIWWKKLGELLVGTESWFEFHIDGLRDTNHLYRIGANWDKVMANVRAFIESGARAEWHYILFKHNQYQIDIARDLARKMGFEHFVPTVSGRFPQNRKFRYMHPEGDFRDLEQVSISVQNEIREIFSSEKIEITSTKDNENVSIVSSINCKAASQNRFFIDSFGGISPCCWITNRDIEQPGDMLKAVAIAGKDLDNYNIHNRPIEEILGDELFSRVFRALWRSGTLATCQKKCGKRHRNIKFNIPL